MIVTLVLIIVVALLGRVWVGLPLRFGRGLAWLSLGAALVFLERFHAGTDPILRMVILCCALLVALKAIVYLEWSVPGRRLPCWRYLGFAFLWFGMDPTPFAAARRSLAWGRDVRIGLICAAVGLAGAMLVREWGWTAWVLPVFVPMSIGVHYGALRLLTAGWRALGFPVRVLFRNPLPVTRLAEFWGRKWNLGYSEMMVRVVKRPVSGVLGRRGSEFAVFAASGLLHEVAITVPVGAGFGLPTLYFLLHGLLMRIERPTWPAWWGRIWTLGWVAGPVGVLFPPEFFEAVILRCLEFLPGG